MDRIHPDNHLYRAVARFVRGDQGAVSVDWVVLSAAVVVLGVMVVLGVRSVAEQLAAEIDTVTRDATVILSESASGEGEDNDGGAAGGDGPGSGDVSGDGGLVALPGTPDGGGLIGDDHAR